ncbi:Protein involved in ribonucleotide reduction [Alteracholeplasma palmae J233]|uniref:Protein involved in ribonucleotide reduction n=1 Tax=Alteracholeplasma palmae (strain ATCC 49389 / J233) TaxID=1318466 RepID=U4KJW6_ALTPJ|nr:class Ib ribonucleoside-diphosphate reductase assembly flavoprotein NrdI [Alteracholeplasma palmae]CCV63753.1 Protein involved in ribonucleotide reduction [Alteracholeplasma palmae J233]
MIIVYDSLTGQSKRFASHLGFQSISIKDYKESNDMVFLLTRSINFGDIPKTTVEFLDKYSNKVIGVAVSGNRNWGENYGKAGEKIEANYHLPLVLKYEGSGFLEDRQYVKDWIYNYLTQKEM